jgi:DNA-binding PadR family transcriptional regulator
MSSELNPTAASILGVLTSGPLTGSEITACIDLTVGHFWHMTRSQVYAELKRLEALEYVSFGAPGARNMRQCTLTPAGENAFRAWVNEEPPVGNVRFALALTMAFQDFLEPGKAIAFLESHRRAHIARLAQYRTYEEKTVEKDFALWSTVRLGIRYEQSIVDWIDEVGAEFARRSRATSGSKKAASKKTAPKKAASKKAASKKAARR